MYDSLREKIKEQLASVCDSEQRVVYTLVQLRKMWERRDRKGEFDVLRLCWDWVVHSKLDKGGAQKVLERIAMEEDQPAETVELALKRNLFQLIDFSSLRRELHQFLRENDIESANLVGQSGWTMFLRYFCRVIADCPLIISSKNKSSLSSVRVEATEIVGDRNQELEIKWLCTRKDGKAPGTYKSRHKFR